MPSLVQSKSGGASSATSLTITLTSATTAGNCLVVHVATQESGSGASVSGITLGGSADNFASGVASASAIVHNEIWVDLNCAGGQTSVVISLTGGSGSFPNVVAWVEEWSGVATASAVDKTSSGNGNSAAFSSGATATTTQASEVIVGSGAAQQTPTGPSSPWTNLAVVSNTNVTTLSMVAGWQVASATGTFTYSGTNSSANWAACVLTLKAAAAATSGTVQPATAVPARRRRPARAWLRFTPVTTTNAAPAPPVSGTVQPATAVPARRRRPARAWLRFTPVTTANAAPAAPVSGTVQPRATVPVPRRHRARAQVRFTPVTTANQVVTRTLLISLASQAGSDDYGNNFPQGILASAGVIEGPKFVGDDFIISTAGAFFYSGTPAAGNLAVSIAAAAGTDDFGNSYVEGTAAYVTTGGKTYALQLGAQTILSTLAPAFFVHNITTPPFTDPAYSATSASPAGCGAEIYSGQATSGSTPAVIAVEDSTESGVAGGLVQLIAGQITLGTSASENIPVPAPSIATLPQDGNSGSTWVSGERAFMNSNWVDNINANFAAIKAALQAAGITL